MTHFVQTQKQKQLLMKVTLTIHLNQFMLQLYQTYKNRQEKVQVGLQYQYFKVQSFGWKQLYQITRRIITSWKELVNVQNIDNNRCFKWCLARYLHPAEHNPKRITKADKDFAKKLDFKDVKFPVKVQRQSLETAKFLKKNPICISVSGYENKERNLCIKTCCEEKHVDLSLIGEKGKGHFVLIKDFNTFMYNHTLHSRKNIFAVIVYKLLVQEKYQNVI